jgi:hypothetical protein
MPRRRRSRRIVSARPCGKVRLLFRNGYGLVCEFTPNPAQAPKRSFGALLREGRRTGKRAKASATEIQLTVPRLLLLTSSLGFLPGWMPSLKSSGSHQPVRSPGMISPKATPGTPTKTNPSSSARGSLVIARFSLILARVCLIPAFMECPQGPVRLEERRQSFSCSGIKKKRHLRCFVGAITPPSLAAWRVATSCFPPNVSLAP